MPRCIVLQPDGKYAIWSSIVDNFTCFGLEKPEEIVDHLCVFGGNKKETAEDVNTELVNINKIGYAYDWSPNWNEAVRIVKSHGEGGALMKKLKELGISTSPMYIKTQRNTIGFHKYWHNWWYNRALTLESVTITEEWRHKSEVDDLKRELEALHGRLGVS